jgi:hypothetical protein
MIHEPRVQEPPRTDIVTPAPVAAYAPSAVMPIHGRASVVGWGALIAGVVAAIASQTLLGVLGLAIGLSIPGTVAGAEAWTIGAGIWLILVSVASLFIGGWVAATYAIPRAENEAGVGHRERNGTMYGLLTWATVTALSVIMIAGMGTTLMGGMVGGVAEGFRPAERPIGQVAPAIAAVGTPEQQQTIQRDRAAGALAPMTPREVAEENVRPQLAGAAWWAFFAMLLGAGAAGFGGYTAATRELVIGKTRRTTRR